MRTLRGVLFIGIVVSPTLLIHAQAPGDIITYAGNGDGAPSSGGYSGDGGPGTSAELFSPIAVALAKAGDLLIPDVNNFCVRKVTASTGRITTVAGMCTVSGYSGDGGLATNAELSFPASLPPDSAGDLYISDASNYGVRKVEAGTNVITTVAGDGTQGYSGDGALATNAELGRPLGLAVDGNGNLYIADAYSNTVRQVNALTGIIT